MSNNGVWIECKCGEMYLIAKYYVEDGRWWDTTHDLGAWLNDHSGYDNLFGGGHEIIKVSTEGPLDI